MSLFGRKKDAKAGAGPEPASRPEREPVAEKTAADLAQVWADSQLLADLIAIKKGPFGNPEKKLRGDISKRLRVKQEDALKHENLLAYSRLDGVEQALFKTRARRERKQFEERMKFEAVARKGETGPTAGREKEDIRKPAAPITPPQAADQQEEAERTALPEPTHAAVSLPSTVGYVGPKTQDVLTELLAIKKGHFGKPEENLRKDIAKRLKIAKADALRDENVSAYSLLPDVQKRLEKIRAKQEKAAAKIVAKKQIVSKAPVVRAIGRPSAQKPEVYIPANLASDVTERSKKLQEIMEEHKRLEDASTKKKVKSPLRVRRIIAMPLILPAKGIAYVLDKISHVFFVLSVTIFSIPLNFGKLILKLIGGLVAGVSKRVGKVSPLGWKRKINQLVIYSGINKTQEEITGITVVNGAILAVIVAVISFFLLGFGPILSVIAAFLAFGMVWIVVYVILGMMADTRTDEVEGTLPDVLQIVSANISAGMTPYNALWVSARKEFGALAEEIKIAQKETLGGKPFTDALTDMSKRVRSNILQRTVRLIIQGMKAGGELPSILQGIGTDIRQMRLLQKEMAANTMSYTLFILFGMILGAPLLFSVSIQFVDIMNRFQPETMDLDLSSTQGSPIAGGMQGFNMMSLGGGGCPRDFDKDGLPDAWEKEHGLNSKNGSDAMNMDPDTNLPYLVEYQQTAEPLPGSCITSGYLSMFAMMALFSIAFFGSILVGLIRSGKQSAGLKLAPLLIAATLGMFWLMNTGMSFFFGSMFGT